jgi:hypothetical protein
LHKAGFNLLVYHYTRREIHLSGIRCIAIKEKRGSILFLLSRIERYIRILFKISLNRRLEQIFGFSFTLFNDRNSIINSLERIDYFTPDLVLTLSKGGSFRPHHALLKMPQFHKNWIAYIHDPYPMHLYPRPFAWVEAGYRKKWKFIRDISERASYSAFPSKLLKEWMGSYFSNFLNTGILIPHQIISFPQDRVQCPDFFSANNFNLLHAGTLLDQRSPKALVKAFQLFTKIHPEAVPHAKIIFVGGQSVYTPWLKEMSNEIVGLIISEDYIPFRQVLQMQQLTTVNIILEAKSEISPFLPGKFPHCIQADKPILLLSPYYSESYRLLGNQYPYWSENDNVNKIAQLIGELYELWFNKTSIKPYKPELHEYLSEIYLKETINKLLINDNN